MIAQRSNIINESYKIHMIKKIKKNNNIILEMTDYQDLLVSGTWLVFSSACREERMTPEEIAEVWEELR